MALPLTASASLRYWNMARQRHCRRLARNGKPAASLLTPSSSEPRTPAGKARVLDARKWLRERDGLSAGGRWIRTLGSPHHHAAVRRSRPRGARYSTSSIMGWWRRAKRSLALGRRSWRSVIFRPALANSLRSGSSALSQRQHKFALDSPLEGAGFEPLVPPAGDDGFRLNFPARFLPSRDTRSEPLSFRHRIISLTMRPKDFGQMSPQTGEATTKRPPRAPGGV